MVMSTLSVCIIAKNESEVIGRVLSCASTFADEIIVVDTGSTDNTKEIAAMYTDKVFDYEWDDDFGAARNFSFDQATMDYCMWLDCDDIVDIENCDKINAMKPFLDTNGDCITARYRVSLNVVNQVTRIIRRGCCRWVGFIHEYLAYSGTRVETDFEVVHAKTEASINRDDGRNLRIFEKKLVQEGVQFSTRDVLYYAKELYWNERYEDALRTIEEYWRRTDRWAEDEVQITIIEGDIWEKLGDLGKKVMVLGNGIARNGLNIRMLFNAGLACINMNRYNDAIFYFRPIIDGIAWSSTYFSDSYEFTFHSMVWTSCAMWYSGKPDDARAMHERAREIHPDSELILNNDKYFYPAEQ